MWCTWLKTVMAPWRRADRSPGPPRKSWVVDPLPASTTRFETERVIVSRDSRDSPLLCSDWPWAKRVVSHALTASRSQVTKCFHKQIQINRRDEVWTYVAHRLWCYVYNLFSHYTCLSPNDQWRQSHTIQVMMVLGQANGIRTTSRVRRSTVYSLHPSPHNFEIS